MYDISFDNNSNINNDSKKSKNIICDTNILLLLVVVKNATPTIVVVLVGGGRRTPHFCYCVMLLTNCRNVITRSYCISLYYTVFTIFDFDDNISLIQK